MIIMIEMLCTSSIRDPYLNNLQAKKKKIAVSLSPREKRHPGSSLATRQNMRTSGCITSAFKNMKKNVRTHWAAAKHWYEVTSLSPPKINEGKMARFVTDK